MNIVIIDDRSERQELKLGTFKKSPFISIYTKAEINDFFDSLKFGAIPKAFSTSDLLCIHDSIAEIKEAPLRKRLEEWCEDRKIPVIWFSGANTHPATIKKSLKYQCDVNTIYNRLKTLVL